MNKQAVKHITYTLNKIENVFQAHEWNLEWSGKNVFYDHKQKNPHFSCIVRVRENVSVPNSYIVCNGLNKLII